MKKLILSILFIICLPFQASAWNPMVVVSGAGAAIPDGELGDDTPQVSGQAAMVAGIWYFNTFSPTTSGNVRYIHFYTRENKAGTSSVCVGIWESVSANPLGYCTITWEDGNSAGWQECDIGGEINVTSAKILGVQETSGVVDFYYSDDGTAPLDHVDYDSSNAASCDGSDQLTDNGDVGTNRHLTIIINNTSGTP